MSCFSSNGTVGVGTPSPDIHNAMEREHHSTESFDSHNVKATNPRREFLYVTTMEVGELPDRHRDATPTRRGWRIDDFVACDRARLYNGVMLGVVAAPSLAADGDPVGRD